MDRYTKGFVVASLAYFFLAAVLGIWMGGTDGAGWVRFATSTSTCWASCR